MREKGEYVLECVLVREKGKCVVEDCVMVRMWKLVTGDSYKRCILVDSRGEGRGRGRREKEEGYLWEGYLWEG